MNFIVDGYNLLYALGLAQRSMQTRALDRARTQMLDWLCEHHAGEHGTVRVVFDAQNSTRPIPPTRNATGISVEYTFRELADDRIESLIRQEGKPRELVIVSNDSRIREAGRKRECAVWRCSEFIDFLLGTPAGRKPRGGRPSPAADAADDPRDMQPSPEEIAEFLAAFEIQKPPR